MFCHRSSLMVLVHVVGMLPSVCGHGHMFWPRARNQPDSNRNGAAAGGPWTVHAFSNAGIHTKYQHGICGNAAGDTQSYNRVGDIQATLIAGTTADIKVLLTAHHVGFFEMELCLDAGQLSEACFMQHRLLRHGCDCSCPSDPTNSCSACDKCRRWWKPVLQGEMHQWVARGYQGLVLPGHHLVAVEFTLQYKIPAGVKTRNGVLRWHYMTTNSCTSKGSSPEEFWNCADVAIADADGDTGGSIVFDNHILESLPVENLVPLIRAQPPILTGINWACPEDSAGQLMGVGSAEEYDGLCGATFTNGTYERCVNSTSSPPYKPPKKVPSDVCNRTIPESGIICQQQCSDWFYECAGQMVYLKPVPLGTKCKDDNFVFPAECDGFSAGIKSGDTVFLMTLSGTGNHVDVQGYGVQARWKSRGSWQALNIEKSNGGTVNSGDIVFLKTHTGAYIHVTGESVEARWNDKGDWQAMVIQKRFGSGAVLPGDVICFKAHTGKHLDVQDAVLRARWDDCGDWQAMSIEKEVSDAVFSGTAIHFLAHTGKRIDVEGQAVQARWSEAGLWQRFIIENEGGRAIFSGDVVFIRAHTGQLIDVEGEHVSCRWSECGDWQRLVIEKKHGSGAVLPGDTVFLRAHTGKVIHVQGDAVHATWSDLGDWQALVVEKSILRRLTDDQDDRVTHGSSLLLL